MSANLNLVDLLKRKQPRQPFDERLPSGQTVPELLRAKPKPPVITLPDGLGDLGMFGSGRKRTLREMDQELDQMTPSGRTVRQLYEADAAQSGGNPALQRAALAVPRGDVVELLKQPTATSPATGMPPPPNEGRRVPESIPPVNVGASTTGQSPIDRQQTLVDLMRSTPAGQKVRQHGDEIDVGPPEQSPSRVKNALVGLLLGVAQGGIPGGIAGVATGAIKPESIQELLKQKHVAREEGQLERQVAIDDKRADSEYRRAQIDALKEGRRQYVERTNGVYEISREYPNGRRVSDIPAEVRAAPAGSVHYEPREDGLYAVVNEGGQFRSVKVPGVPGKPASDAQGAQAAEGEALAESTQAAANELKATLDQQKDQLTENEKAIRNKEAAWRTEAQRQYDELHKKVPTKDSDGVVRDVDPNIDDERKLKDFIEEVKAADADYQKGVYDETVENTKRLRDAIADGDKRYSGMQQDVRQGQAKGARRRGGGASTTTQQPYAGRTMSAANLARYAKDKGISEAEARRQVEGMGVKVQ